jgi:hypothetical protein
MLGSEILEQGSAGNGFPRNLVQNCIKKDIYFLIDATTPNYFPRTVQSNGRAPGPFRLTASTHFEDPGTDRALKDEMEKRPATQRLITHPGVDRR